MLVLGIDTSSMVGSVGLSRDGRPITRRTISVDMEHSANLLPSMQALLADAGIELEELGAVCVGVGPGSYTGVRVGIAFAKGLAYGLKIPVIGVCSFESMLYEHAGFEGVICTLVDAKMGGTYWAAYRWEGKDMAVVRAPTVSTTEEVEFECAGRALFLSPEIEKFVGVLREKFAERVEADFRETFPDAGYIAVRGEERQRKRQPEEGLEPYYLRPSMAEITWAKKRKKN
jgi:tRNA threonylcarbamoyladenosine biosynthesis protein TsaB